MKWKKMYHIHDWKLHLEYHLISTSKTSSTMKQSWVRDESSGGWARKWKKTGRSIVTLPSILGINFSHWAAYAIDLVSAHCRPKHLKWAITFHNWSEILYEVTNLYQIHDWHVYKHCILMYNASMYYLPLQIPPTQNYKLQSFTWPYLVCLINPSSTRPNYTSEIIWRRGRVAVGVIIFQIKIIFGGRCETRNIQWQRTYRLTCLIGPVEGFSTESNRLSGAWIG